MSNTFIPLKILDTRLCGDWPGRQQAYTRDWLTFCAFTVALELEKPDQDQRNIHDLLPNELVPKYQDAQELKRKLSQWDGSHLVARDSAGSVPAMAGAKFLYHLLHRDDMKSMSASKVARHIFIRWCRKSTLEISSPLFQRLPSCSCCSYCRLCRKGAIFRQGAILEDSQRSCPQPQFGAGLPDGARSVDMDRQIRNSARQEHIQGSDQLPKTFR